MEPEGNIIKGIVFEDLNQNGLYDKEESAYSNLRILQLPDSVYTYTNDTSFYEFRVVNPINDIVIENSQNCFQDEVRVTVNISDSTDNSVFNVPLLLGLTTKEAKLHVSSNRSRCGFTERLVLTVENSGCGRLNGELKVSSNDLIEILNIDNSNFDIVNLALYSKVNFELAGRIANEDFVVDTIQVDLDFERDVNLKYQYKEVISCSFASNDKTVTPII